MCILEGRGEEQCLSQWLLRPGQYLVFQMEVQKR